MPPRIPNHLTRIEPSPLVRPVGDEFPVNLARLRIGHSVMHCRADVRKTARALAEKWGVTGLAEFKAGATVVLLVVGVGLALWARTEQRTVAQGTWDLDPGEGQMVRLEVSKTVGMKVECVAREGEAYAILVVDEAYEALMTAAGSEGVETVASVEGSGAVTLEPTTVMPGKYCVVVENRGQGRLSVKYRVYQMPR